VMSARSQGYIAADCARCGRQRLELFVEGEETAVGIRCEKCFGQWSLAANAATTFQIEGPYFEEGE